VPAPGDIGLCAKVCMVMYGGFFKNPAVTVKTKTVLLPRENHFLVKIAD
jgi:hypothetical protein